MARARSGRRTDYTWTQFGDVITGHDLGSVSSFTGASVGFSITFAAAQTLTRVRGRIGVTLDTGGVGESALVLAGLTIVGLDAATGGVLPEIYNVAVSADEASWIWQGQLYVSSGAEAAIVTDQLSASIEVDAKAMRRVKPQETLVMCFQTPAELTVDQAGTLDVSYFGHVLTGA